jgi:cytoskeletal protein RodZ
MEEIGKALKAKRKELRYTLEAVSTCLKIREKYLECIENGDLDKIPGKAYAKGYIKEYAKFLKLTDYKNFEILEPKAVHEIIHDEKVKNIRLNIAPSKAIIFTGALTVVCLYLFYSRI